MIRSRFRVLYELAAALRALAAAIESDAVARSAQAGATAKFAEAKITEERGRQNRFDRGGWNRR